MLKPAEAICENTLAWCLVWLGYATERLGDLSSANQYYGRAHSLQQNIPRQPVKTRSSSVTPPQVERVVRQLRTKPTGPIRLPQNIDKNLWALNGKGSVPQTEEALKFLGEYLGFESSRPEKEVKTGPDVLWLVDDLVAICMEAKTQKEAQSVYKKTDIGQLGDHVQWVRDNTNASDIVPIFVGPPVPASSSANPTPDALVIELEQFDLLRERLVAALSDVTANALVSTLPNEVAGTFADRDLLWPRVFELVVKHTLREIKQD